VFVPAVLTVLAIVLASAATAAGRWPVVGHAARTTAILAAAAIVVVVLGLVLGTATMRRTSRGEPDRFPAWFEKLQTRQSWRVTHHGTTCWWRARATAWTLPDKGRLSGANGQGRELLARLTELKLDESVPPPRRIRPPRRRGADGKEPPRRWCGCWTASGG